MSVPVSFKFLIPELHDDFLYYLIEHMMVTLGGENRWFEVKRRLPQEQVNKFPKLIAAISNSGGGLIFYGWDEKNSVPVTIQRDDIERLILPKIKECDPEIPIEFHSVRNNSNQGLFVGVPFTGSPIKIRDTEEYYYRAGGHKSILESKSTLELLEHFQKEHTGHLYNSQLIKLINKLKPQFIANGLFENKIQLGKLKKEIIDDIKTNWSIRFGPWLSDPPHQFPIRVFFDMWLPSSHNTNSIDLQKVIMNLISSTIKFLNEAEGILNLHSQIIQLNKYLCDTSLNESDSPINHRRCLTTLINRLNIWNFADARIYLDKNEVGYHLYQDSAGREYVKKFAQLERIDREEIERLVNSHVKERYYRFVDLLIDDIVMHYNQIIIQLDPESY